MTRHPWTKKRPSTSDMSSTFSDHIEYRFELNYILLSNLSEHCYCGRAPNRSEIDDFLVYFLPPRFGDRSQD